MRNRLVALVTEKKLSFLFMQNLLTWDTHLVVILGRHGGRYGVEVSKERMFYGAANRILEVARVTITHDGRHVGHFQWVVYNPSAVHPHFQIYRPDDRRAGVGGEIFALLGQRMPDGLNVYTTFGGILTDARDIVRHFWHIVTQWYAKEELQRLETMLNKIDVIENAYGSVGQNLFLDQFSRQEWVGEIAPAMDRKRDKAFLFSILRRLVLAGLVSLESEVVQRTAYSKLLRRMGVRPIELLQLSPSGRIKIRSVKVSS
jgi:hypothetical protein